MGADKITHLKVSGHYHKYCFSFTVQAVTGDIENLCDCESPCNVDNYPFTSTNVKLRAKYMQQIYSETEHNFTVDYIE